MYVYIYIMFAFSFIGRPSGHAAAAMSVEYHLDDLSSDSDDCLFGEDAFGNDGHDEDQDEQEAEQEDGEESYVYIYIYIQGFT